VQHTSLYMKDSTDFANIVDISTRQMVNEFEKNKETIHLDSCDIYTALNKKYDCKMATFNHTKYLLIEVIINFRNRNIADKIMNSADKKILVVYGSKHYKGLKNLLKN
jgi:pheromone shutdown protein TraB